MNGRERLQAVWEGRTPDRVPHFELLFQITEDAFGQSWPTKEQMDGAGAKEREKLRDRYYVICEKIIESYDWAAIQLPESLHGYFDGKMIPDGKKRFGDKVMVFDFNGMGTFWMPNGAEMVEYYALFYEEPAKAHEEARRKMRDSIELARRQVDQGVDFIIINSDYAFNEGPFLSPQMFKEFVTPYLSEIVGRMHDMGTKALLHSDGDLRRVLDQLVSTGIDGYQSIDPQGHMDIASVKKEYGERLVLMGNVQAALLQTADDQTIRKCVRYCINSGKPNGRYIFSTSNTIFAGMPLESYTIMLDEYRKLAAY